MIKVTVTLEDGTIVNYVPEVVAPESTPEVSPETPVDTPAE